MSTAVLKDAFGHHVWATLRLIDVCLALEPNQLASAAPGTYGSILDTMRHLVGSDGWYLYRMTGDRTFVFDDERAELAELRAEMRRHGEAWPKVIAGDHDPDAVVVARHDDGSETHASAGIRLAQALHHGTDHRSQVCTALTSLGMEPPAIDVWDYAMTVDRLVEVPPPSGDN